MARERVIDIVVFIVIVVANVVVVVVIVSSFCVATIERVFLSLIGFSPRKTKSIGLRAAS